MKWLSLTLLLTTVRLAAPEEKARLPIPSPELPLRAQLLTVNVPPLKVPVARVAAYLAITDRQRAETSHPARVAD